MPPPQTPLTQQPTPPTALPAEGTPPSPPSTQAQQMEALDDGKTPPPRVAQVREECDAMAQSIQSLQPGSSRKARVEELDRLARAGERAGPGGVAQLIEEHGGSVWEALLEQSPARTPGPGTPGGTSATRSATTALQSGC